MHSILILAMVLASAQAESAPVVDGQPTANDWLCDWLVLEPTGTRGRVPIVRDALLHELALGRLARPVEGDSYPTLTEARHVWKKATADDEGWVRSPALRGGHAAMTVSVGAPRTMLLEAAGHSAVYCNGEPRAGDPYATGYVRLPVRLRAGDNDLLFRVGRGRVRARLLPLPSEALLNVNDPTLPDAVVGEHGDLIGAVVVINGTSKPLRDAWIEAELEGAEPVRTPVAPIEPLTVRKTAFGIRVPPDLPAGNLPLRIRLFRGDENQGRPLDSADLKFRVRAKGDVYKRTFISGIDRSVQYYAVRQASEPGPQALFLTLHGAGVEATGQARAYAAKTWGHVVAPTNRRPYGFDWEDWGRWDALEVLDRASDAFDIDPERVYLTGHSMGGHGTWHVGVTFPDRFAAIAPSAGWVSFWSYAGADRPDGADPVAALLQRSTLASDTLALADNLRRLGVFVLHGSEDNNVPVTQARQMRTSLAEFHPDFVYHEQPGAGHWWGNRCVDWPELFTFFQNRKRALAPAPRSVRFYTASPGVSARSDWVTVEMQESPFERSYVEISLDEKARRIAGRTENVRRLVIDLNALVSAPDDKVEKDDPAFAAGSPLELVLDQQTLTDVAWPDDGTLRLRRDKATWAVTNAAPRHWKGPHRYGPFKNVFRNGVVLVYGTVGDDEENAWAYAKARYDAETFWYRGNGTMELLPDVEYDAKAYRGRNVVLYGNADTNATWSTLLKTSPVQVRRDAVRVGERSWTGDDLAVLFVRPVPGDGQALVGVVGGSGLAGMRTTVGFPYFVSGVAYPDCTVFRANALRDGAQGVLVAGFFGERWDVESGPFSYRARQKGDKPLPGADER